MNKTDYSPPTLTLLSHEKNEYASNAKHHCQKAQLGDGITVVTYAGNGRNGHGGGPVSRKQDSKRQAVKVRRG
jgi:hypothetical protein